MSSKIDTVSDTSLSKQEPLTVREKTVNLLEGTTDEQHRVNTELDKEIETEALHLNRQVQLVKVDLDDRSTAVKDKEFDLDNELKKTKQCSIEADERFQENARKLTKLQEQIEHAERRSTVAEQRIASLEQDTRHAYVEMKSSIQAKENDGKTMEDLQSQLKSAQQRTDEAETSVEKLQMKLDKLKEKLVNERNKCH